MSGSWRVGALLCLVACVRAPQTPPAINDSGRTAHYRVTIADNFEGARVEACLENLMASDLVPIDDSVARDLRGAWIEGAKLDTRSGRIPLTPAPKICVEYETRLSGNWFVPSVSSAVIVSQAQWLWRPEPFPAQLEASVRFVLPAQSRVSLPWPHVDDAYSLDESAFYTDTYAVFGRFDQKTFTVDGTRIDVARLGGRPADADIERWLGRAVRTAGSLGGGFPRERLQVVVAAVDSPDEEVAFGMLRRGGGPSILLLPSTAASGQGLEKDWVAIHELSHLWLPRVRSQDRWLSEGIATYLQEVLRARCGLQSSERAWTRLRDGFERGRRSGTGRRLASESRQMRRTGAYQRVYWAGAAFALEADVRLRERSGGATTLLTALHAAQPRWASDAHPVSAPSLLAALDAVDGGGFIAELGAGVASSSAFPNTAYADMPDYVEMRTRITSLDEEACGISVESSR